MGDGVDEAVMLLVAANFADQKNRIEDKAGNDGAEENDAEKNFDALAPVEDDPAAADRERHRRQANAEREECVDRLLAADDAHREIVAGWGKGVRQTWCFGHTHSAVGDRLPTTGAARYGGGWPRNFVGVAPANGRCA